MEVTIEQNGKKNILVIRAEIPAKLEPSKSGKNLLLASTGGNLPTAVKYNGKTVTVGLNAYVKSGD